MSASAEEIRVILHIRQKHAQDVADLIAKRSYTTAQAADYLQVSEHRITQILSGDVAHIPTQHLMDMKRKFGAMCGC